MNNSKKSLVFVTIRYPTNVVVVGVINFLTDSFDSEILLLSERTMKNDLSYDLRDSKHPLHSRLAKAVVNAEELENS